MKKALTFFSIIVLLLVGCAGKTEGNVNENDSENQTDHVKDKNNHDNEEANNNNESQNNYDNENEETSIEIEEETVADEIRILDVETVLLDQKEATSFNANEIK